jgi:hypothetical protein
MNIIELFLFLFAIGLTVLIATYLYAFLWWWAILPAAIIGFGTVWLLIFGLDRLASRRNKPQQPPD